MTELKDHYKYIVIGAGSGGLTVAAGLKAFNKDFLLIAKELGGECTNTGCVPSKTLLKVADEYSKNNSSNKNLHSIIEKKIDEIKSEERKLIQDMNFVEGEAKLINKSTVTVNNKKITFKKCIIATGSSPKLLKIDGVSRDKILTNESIFNLKEAPESLNIVGGGPVACELATAFAKLGTSVNMVIRSNLLPKEPRYNSKVVLNSLEKLGVKIYENSVIDKVEKGKVILKKRDKNIAIDDAQYYLLALGRNPHTDLHLEKAGVKYSKAGIKVDKNLKTNNRKIFAIGDCTQHQNFTHLANDQGRFIVKKLLLPFSNRKKVTLPAVTFTDPKIASVGQVEESDLVKEFYINFSNSDRAIIDEKNDLQGLVYIHKLSGRIKGASVTGDFSEHIINFFSLAIHREVSIFKLGNFITPYPTYFNSINTLNNMFLKYFLKNFKNNLLIIIRKNLTRITALTFWIIAAILMLTYLYQINFDQNKLINQLDTLLTDTGGIIFFILIYCIRPLILFPATLLSILAGSIYGFWLGLFLNLLASTLSSIVSYSLGRYVFSRKKYSNYSKLRDYLNENSFEAVLISRLAFTPYDLVSYIAGGLKLNLFKFITATVLGASVGTVAVTSFGASLENINNFNEFEIDSNYVVLSVVFIFISILISTLTQKLKSSVGNNT